MSKDDDAGTPGSNRHPPYAKLRRAHRDAKREQEGLPPAQPKSKRDLLACEARAFTRPDSLTEHVQPARASSDLEATNNTCGITDLAQLRRRTARCD